MQSSSICRSLAGLFLAAGLVLFVPPRAGSHELTRQGDPKTPPKPVVVSLIGTSWQLVKFESEGKAVTPDDGSKYTVEFLAEGRLTTRFDCNRGRGTWTSEGPNRIRFGTMTITRAMCPPGSLHDQMLKHWGSIRSYAIKEGHLYLSLTEKGGTYEFEPMRKA